jgi:hypothetical protein
MRIEFTAEGGIAGLPRKATIDTYEKTITVGVRDRTIGTEELPAEEAEHLERLVDVVGDLRKSATPAPPPGAADYQVYVLSVDNSKDRGPSYQVRLWEPIEDPGAKDLVNDLNRLWEKRINAHLASRKRDTR